MKSSLPLLFSLLVSIAFCTSIQGQCYKRESVYSRPLISFEIGNYQVEAGKGAKDDYFVFIDTLQRISIYNNTQNINNQYTVTGYFDHNIHSFKYSIIDQSTDSIYDLGYKMGFSNFYYDIIFNDEFIFLNNYSNSVVFRFDNKTIEKIDYTFMLTGYDNSSIYFELANKKKWAKEKYYPNSIFKLDTTGFYNIQAASKRKWNIDSNYIFNNQYYKVKNIKMYDEEKDCMTIQHFTTSIYIGSGLVDTINFVSDYFYEPKVIYSNDTLTVFLKNEMRKYFKDKIITRLNIMDSLCAQPELKGLAPFYIIDNDYIIARVKKVLPQSQVGEGQKILISNNGIPLNGGFGEYHELYLFDAHTYKFLGFPKIVYSLN